ncbi:MAG: hypothetical protein NZ529_02775, partial [Cytophagaceae bacterium]|nr:hypothetical protein [Cytophagaceae bacterium]MDW8455695.1 hypothetical protein [Cytophagaceae bacterium]
SFCSICDCQALFISQVNSFYASARQKALCVCLHACEAALFKDRGLCRGGQGNTHFWEYHQ